MKNKRKVLVSLFSLIIFIGYTQNDAQSDTTVAKTCAHDLLKNMGGKNLWEKMTYVKFQHVWYPINKESYIEDEIIDLVEIRSWVQMKSEVYKRIRAYSKENGYWSITNGVMSKANEMSLQNAIKRGPYNFYRILKAIATNNSRYEFKIGESEIPAAQALEIYYDGEYGGKIILNGRMEPLVWETMQYKYTFGPLRKYGNLSHPAWAVYNNGSYMYEMISLFGFAEELDSTIFIAPD